MGIAVVIAGTTRNSYVTPSSIVISKRLSEPATANVTLRDETGSLIPVVGNAVDIKDQGGTTRFFGTIQDVEVKKIDDVLGVECRLSITDNTYATTRRISGQYEWIDKTVLYIVSDIVTNSLYSDLTDVSLVATGPTIPRFSVSMATVKEAFDALAELAGMRWWIDELNRLHFTTPSSATAPFAITDTTNVTRLSVRGTREDYCNVVIAFVGSALRDPDAETFVGNGSLTSFTLAYPVGQTPTILVDGVEKTVGVTDVDTGKDFYWAQGSAEIRQDSGGTVLTSGNTLSVTYVGLEQIFVTVSDAAEITARATAEGNSGRYEKLIEISDVITQADATTRAQAYLDRYSTLTYELAGETTDFHESTLLQLQPGHVLAMSAPGYGTTGNFLVQSVEFSHMEGVSDQDTYQWRGRIRATNGPPLRTFTDLFRQTASGGTVSGTGSAGTIGGAGVFMYEVALTANATITVPFSATPGAILTVYVEQGSGPYSISLDAAQFGGSPNTNISSRNGGITVFQFCGREDSKWWQVGIPAQDIQ